MSGGTWSWAGATPLGIADDAEPDNNAAIATDADPAMTVLGTLTGAGAETSNTSAAIDDANAEAPAPTLVTTAGSGLAFNLIWDPERQFGTIGVHDRCDRGGELSGKPTEQPGQSARCRKVIRTTPIRSTARRCRH